MLDRLQALEQQQALTEVQARAVAQPSETERQSYQALYERYSTSKRGKSLTAEQQDLLVAWQSVEAGQTTNHDGSRELLVVALGGAIVGGILGYLSLPIFVRLHDSLSSLLLTVALSLGTFQIGQALGVSGAVAVVVAGLIFGTLGLTRTLSASDRITLLSFWEYAGFGVNTFIFLLIGIEINPATLWSILPSILFVIVAYQLD